MPSFTLSPGVVVQEIDNTLTVPAQSTTVGAAAGVFAWGPVAEPQLVASEPQLVATYGRPITGYNDGTWWNTDNFLQYSNAIWVNRASDSNTINAVGGGAGATAYLIPNQSSFSSLKDSIPSNDYFIAKYPGAIGNSLQVVVCDSASAFSSNTTVPANTAVTFSFASFSNSATLSVVADSNTDATTAATAILNQLALGDFVSVGNSSVGSAVMQISSLGTPTVTANATSTAVINFVNKAYITGSWTANTLSRTWQYSNLVAAAPKTSAYVAQHGGVGDQISVIVIDQDGQFTNQPGAILEVYDRLSRATDSLDASGRPNYYKTVINNQSPFIWAGVDISTAPSATSSTVTAATDVIPLSYTFTLGVDSASENAIGSGPLMQAFAPFKDKSQYQILYVLAGVIQDTTIPDYLISNIAEERMDCVVFVTPPADTMIGQQSSNVPQNLATFVSTLPGSTYAFVDSGWKYQFDSYNNTYVWVPLNGDIAGLDAALPDIWDSPAGYTQAIKNCIKLAYNPSNQADRDYLYQLSINPVVMQPGQGFVLFGDKMFTSEPSAFNRINTRMLFIYLEQNISNYAKFLLFKFNNPTTRSSFVNSVQPFCDEVYGRGGMAARAKIQCDSTNNPDSVVENHQFVANVMVVPQYTIESILLQFTAVNGSVQVTETPVTNL